MCYPSSHHFTVTSEGPPTLVVGPPALLKVSTGADNFAIFGEEGKQSGCGVATNTEENESLICFMGMLLKFNRSSNDDEGDRNKLTDDSDEPLLRDRNVTCFGAECSGADSACAGTSESFLFLSIGETLMGVYESFLDVAAEFIWIR